MAHLPGAAAKTIDKSLRGTELEDATIIDVDSLKKFTIPKRRKNKKEELFEKVSLDTRAYLNDVLPVVTQSYKDRNSASSFQYSELCLIHNERLTTPYLDKRKDMRTAGYSEKEVCDSYGFLYLYNFETAKRLCTDGIKVGNCEFSCLGNAKMAVCVQRHADILHSSPLLNGQKGYLMVFKIIKGKIKSMPEGSSELDPTPNFDCHVSKNTAIEQLPIKQQYDLSQVYLYGYNDDLDIEERPRQILPYALLRFHFIGNVERSLSKVSKSGDVKSGKQPRPGQAIRTPEIKPPGTDISYFIVWSGKVRTNSGKFAWDVEMISYSSGVKPGRIIDDIVMRTKVGIVAAEKRYLDGVSGISKVQETCHYGWYYNYCEMRVSKNSDAKLSTLVSHLKVSNRVIIQKLEDDVDVILIPDGDLTQRLGIPAHKSSLSILHCVFVSKSPRIGNAVKAASSIPIYSQSSKTSSKMPHSPQVWPNLNQETSIIPSGSPVATSSHSKLPIDNQDYWLPESEREPTWVAESADDSAESLMLPSSGGDSDDQYGYYNPSYSLDAIADTSSQNTPSAKELIETISKLVTSHKQQNINSTINIDLIEKCLENVRSVVDPGAGTDSPRYDEGFTAPTSNIPYVRPDTLFKAFQAEALLQHRRNSELARHQGLYIFFMSYDDFHPFYPVTKPKVAPPPSAAAAATNAATSNLVSEPIAIPGNLSEKQIKRDPRLAQYINKSSPKSDSMKISPPSQSVSPDSKSSKSGSSASSSFESQAGSGDSLPKEDSIYSMIIQKPNVSVRNLLSAAGRSSVDSAESSKVKLVIPPLPSTSKLNPLTPEDLDITEGITETKTVTVSSSSSAAAQQWPPVGPHQISYVPTVPKFKPKDTKPKNGEPLGRKPMVDYNTSENNGNSDVVSDADFVRGMKRKYSNEPVDFHPPNKIIKNFPTNNAVAFNSEFKMPPLSTENKENDHIVQMHMLPLQSPNSKWPQSTLMFLTTIAPKYNFFVPDFDWKKSDIEELYPWQFHNHKIHIGTVMHDLKVTCPSNDVDNKSTNNTGDPLQDAVTAAIHVPMIENGDCEVKLDERERTLITSVNIIMHRDEHKLLKRAVHCTIQKLKTPTKAKPMKPPLDLFRGNLLDNFADLLKQQGLTSLPIPSKLPSNEEWGNQPFFGRWEKAVVQRKDAKSTETNTSSPDPHLQLGSLPDVSDSRSTAVISNASSEVCKGEEIKVLTEMQSIVDNDDVDNLSSVGSNIDIKSTSVKPAEGKCKGKMSYMCNKVNNVHTPSDTTSQEDQICIDLSSISSQVSEVLKKENDSKPVKIEKAESQVSEGLKEENDSKPVKIEKAESQVSEGLKEENDSEPVKMEKAESQVSEGLKEENDSEPVEIEKDDSGHFESFILIDEYVADKSTTENNASSVGEPKSVTKSCSVVLDKLPNDFVSPIKISSKLIPENVKRLLNIGVSKSSAICSHEGSRPKKDISRTDTDDIKTRSVKTKKSLSKADKKMKSAVSLVSKPGSSNIKQSVSNKKKNHINQEIATPQETKNSMAKFNNSSCDVELAKEAAKETTLSDVIRNNITSHSSKLSGFKIPRKSSKESSPKKSDLTITKAPTKELEVEKKFESQSSSRKAESSYSGERSTRRYHPYESRPSSARRDKAPHVERITVYEEYRTLKDLLSDKSQWKNSDLQLKRRENIKKKMIRGALNMARFERYKFKRSYHDNERDVRKFVDNPLPDEVMEDNVVERKPDDFHDRQEKGKQLDTLLNDQPALSYEYEVGFKSDEQDSDFKMEGKSQDTDDSGKTSSHGSIVKRDLESILSVEEVPPLHLFFETKKKRKGEYKLVPVDVPSTYIAYFPSTVAILLDVEVEINPDLEDPRPQHKPPELDVEDSSVVVDISSVNLSALTVTIFSHGTPSDKADSVGISVVGEDYSDNKFECDTEQSNGDVTPDDSSEHRRSEEPPASPPPFYKRLDSLLEEEANEFTKMKKELLTPIILDGKFEKNNNETKLSLHVTTDKQLHESDNQSDLDSIEQQSSPSIGRHDSNHVNRKSVNESPLSQAMALFKEEIAKIEKENVHREGFSTLIDNLKSSQKQSLESAIVSLNKTAVPTLKKLNFSCESECQKQFIVNQTCNTMTPSMKIDQNEAVQNSMIQSDSSKINFLKNHNELLVPIMDNNDADCKQSSDNLKNNYDLNNVTSKFELENMLLGNSLSIVNGNDAKVEALSFLDITLEEAVGSKIKRIVTENLGNDKDEKTGSDNRLCSSINKLIQDETNIFMNMINSVTQPLLVNTEVHESLENSLYSPSVPTLSPTKKVQYSPSHPTVSPFKKYAMNTNANSPRFSDIDCWELLDKCYEENVSQLFKSTDKSNEKENVGETVVRQAELGVDVEQNDDDDTKLHHDDENENQYSQIVDHCDLSQLEAAEKLLKAQLAEIDESDSEITETRGNSVSENYAAITARKSHHKHRKRKKLKDVVGSDKHGKGTTKNVLLTSAAKPDRLLSYPDDSSYTNNEDRFSKTEKSSFEKTFKQVTIGQVFNHSVREVSLTDTCKEMDAKKVDDDYSTIDMDISDDSITMEKDEGNSPDLSPTKHFPTLSSITQSLLSERTRGLILDILNKNGNGLDRTDHNAVVSSDGCASTVCQDDKKHYTSYKTRIRPSLSDRIEQITAKAMNNSFSESIVHNSVTSSFLDKKYNEFPKQSLSCNLINDKTHVKSNANGPNENLSLVSSVSQPVQSTIANSPFAIQNQSFQNQSLHNRGLHNQNVAHQSLQNQSLHNRGLHNQNVEHQTLQNQSLHNRGLHNQNVAHQSLQNPVLSGYYPDQIRYPGQFVNGSFYGTNSFVQPFGNPAMQQFMGFSPAITQMQNPWVQNTTFTNFNPVLTRMQQPSPAHIPFNGSVTNGAQVLEVKERDISSFSQLYEGTPTNIKAETNTDVIPTDAEKNAEKQIHKSEEDKDKMYDSGNLGFWKKLQKTIPGLDMSAIGLVSKPDGGLSFQTKDKPAVIKHDHALKKVNSEKRERIRQQVQTLNLPEAALMAISSLVDEISDEEEEKCQQEVRAEPVNEKGEPPMLETKQKSNHCFPTEKLENVQRDKFIKLTDYVSEKHKSHKKSSKHRKQSKTYNSSKLPAAPKDRKSRSEKRHTNSKEKSISLKSHSLSKTTSKKDIAPRNLRKGERCSLSPISSSSCSSIFSCSTVELSPHSLGPLRYSNPRIVRSPSPYHRSSSWSSELSDWSSLSSLSSFRNRRSHSRYRSRSISPFHVRHRYSRRYSRSPHRTTSRSPYRNTRHSPSYRRHNSRSYSRSTSRQRYSRSFSQSPVKKRTRSSSLSPKRYKKTIRSTHHSHANTKKSTKSHPKLKKSSSRGSNISCVSPTDDKRSCVVDAKKKESLDTSKWPLAEVKNRLPGIPGISCNSVESEVKEDSKTNPGVMQLPTLVQSTYTNNIENDSRVVIESSPPTSPKRKFVICSGDQYTLTRQDDKSTINRVTLNGPDLTSDCGHHISVLINRKHQIASKPHDSVSSTKKYVSQTPNIVPIAPCAQTSTSAATSDLSDNRSTFSVIESRLGSRDLRADISRKLAEVREATENSLEKIVNIQDDVTSLQDERKFQTSQPSKKNIPQPARKNVRLVLKKDSQKEDKTSLSSSESKEMFVFVFTGNDTGEHMTKTIKSNLETQGARVFDPYNVELITPTKKSDINVLIINNQLKNIHKVPNILNLRHNKRVNFYSFNNDVDVRNRLFTPLLQRGGIVIPDDDVLVNCDPTLVEEILKFMQKQCRDGHPWSMKIHSQIVCKLAATKDGLSPAQRQSDMHRILTMLTEYRNAGVVELLPKHDCDTHPKPVQEYLPCIIEQQTKHAKIFRFMVVLTDVSSKEDATNVVNLNNHGLDVVNPSQFLVKFARNAAIFPQRPYKPDHGLHGRVLFQDARPSQASASLPPIEFSLVGD